MRPAEGAELESMKERVNKVLQREKIQFDTSNFFFVLRVRHRSLSLKSLRGALGVRFL